MVTSMTAKKEFPKKLSLFGRTIHVKLVSKKELVEFWEDSSVEGDFGEISMGSVQLIRKSLR